MITCCSAGGRRPDLVGLRAVRVGGGSSVSSKNDKVRSLLKEFGKSSMTGLAAEIATTQASVHDARATYEGLLPVERCSG
jgi:hypothetical protein